VEKLTVEVPPESICIKNASCMNGHSLMDEAHLMDGQPSIRLFVEAGEGHGVIHLHPRYGNFEVDSTLELKDGETYEVFCPTCKVSLKREEERCMFCGARMFTLHLPESGLVQACSRRGCHNHKLRVVDLTAQLAQLFEEDTRPRF